MRQIWIGLLVMAGFFIVGKAVMLGGGPAAVQSPSKDWAGTGMTLRAERSSLDDLEVGGDLAGLPPGSTRYLTRNDLLALPQVRYTVTDDANFAVPAKVSGVPLEELVRRLGATPEAELAIAICYDKYRAHYPRSYLAAHHPLLVLEVNGQPPAGWPKDPEGNAMGPFLISHANFPRKSKNLQQPDEVQIPWGVVRLEFRQEAEVFGAIAPRGPHAGESSLQAGFAIARQNCFRCHNMAGDGGQKAGISWTMIAALSSAAPDLFAAYVRNPQAKNPRAKMPGNPDFDNATIAALQAYFQSFSPQNKP